MFRWIKFNEFLKKELYVKKDTGGVNNVSNFNFVFDERGSVEMLIYQVVLWSCAFLIEERLSRWSLHSSLGNIPQNIQSFSVHRQNDNFKSCPYIAVSKQSKTLLGIIAKYAFSIRAWSLLYQALFGCLWTKTLWIVSAKMIGQRNERSLLAHKLRQTFHRIGWF